jgi:hypothetical protein
MYKRSLAILLILISVQYMAAQINVVLMPESEDDADATTHCIIKQKGQKYQLVNQNGKVLAAKLDSIKPDVKTGFYRIVQDGKQGILSPFGKCLIPTQYNKIEETYSYPYWFVKKNHKTGIYAIKLLRSENIIPCIYDSIGLTSNYKPKFIIKDNKKLGILDEKGQVILPIVYDQISRIDSDIYQLRKNQTTSYFFNYKTIIDSIDIGQYFTVSRGRFLDERASYYIASKGRKKGMLDKDGNVIIHFQYDNILGKDQNQDTHDILAVQKDSLWGIIDYNEKIIVPLKYSDLQYYLGSYIILGDKHQKYFYNFATNKYITDYTFEEIRYVTDDYSVVSKDGKEALVDNKHDYRLIFPFKYEEIRYKDKVITVKDKGKYGVIDIENKMIVPIIYDELYFFCDDKAVVQKDNKYGVLSITDNRLLIPMTERVITAYTGRFSISKTETENAEYYDSNLNKINP